MMLTLEPQDDFQAHLVQVLLAKLQGKVVELKLKDGGWADNWEVSLLDSLNWETYNYRIVQQPLLSAEQWKLIKPKYKWAVKDLNDKIMLCSHKPHIPDFTIHSYGRCSKIDYTGDVIVCPLRNVDPDNVYWRDSLQKRPEETY